MRSIRKGGIFKQLDAKKKVIAVDFDGTLVHNTYPYIENPNVRLLEYIRTNRDKYIWILWTCRQEEQLGYAVEWLKNEQGIEFDLINQNTPWNIEQYGKDTRKIFADFYIDDKMISVKDLDKIS